MNCLGNMASGDHLGRWWWWRRRSCTCRPNTYVELLSNKPTLLKGVWHDLKPWERGKIRILYTPSYMEYGRSGCKVKNYKRPILMNW